MPLNRQGLPGLNQIIVSSTHRLKRCASALFERLKPVDLALTLLPEWSRLGAESRLSQTVISRDRMSRLCMRLLFEAVKILQIPQCLFSVVTVTSYINPPMMNAASKSVAAASQGTHNVAHS